MQDTLTCSKYLDFWVSSTYVRGVVHRCASPREDRVSRGRGHSLESCKKHSRTESESTFGMRSLTCRELAAVVPDHQQVQPPMIMVTHLLSSLPTCVLTLC